MNREEELELLKQQKFNNIKIRGKAAVYAKTFLAKKYREEYKELYEAYLHNRGYTTRASKELLDERLVSE
jgi:hypothetical protein